MKKLASTLIVCLLMLQSFSLIAQGSTILKSFINENELAVRSVQKHSINLNDQASEDNVKELLRLHIASVKLFNSNPSRSADIAYFVREKCSAFLTKNSKGSLEYLILTDKEKAFFVSPKPVEKVNSNLTKTELQKINSVNVKDPHLFDDLNIHIN